MTRHIGIDLHRNRFTVCTLVNGRNYLRTWEMKKLAAFCRWLRPEDELAGGDGKHAVVR